MLNGVLNSLVQLALDVLKTANVLPVDIGNLNLALTERGGVNDCHGMLKVLLFDNDAVKNHLVDLVLVKVNEAHLATDALKGRLHTKLLEISTDVTMGSTSEKLKVDVLAETHIPGLDLKNFQTSGLIGDAHVEFAIETTRTTEGGLNNTLTVSRGNDNNLGGRFEAIHECEKLGNDTLLDFTSSLLTLGGNGIDLINKDNGTTVILGISLGVLKGTSQVGFTLSSLLRDNLRTIDDEEIGAGLSSNSTSHGGLTATRWSSQKNTAGRVDTKLPPKLRVLEGQLNELPNSGKMLARSTDGIVSSSVEVVLVALNRLTVALNNGVVHNDAGRVSINLNSVDLNALELQNSKRSVDTEGIATSQGTELALKVGAKVVLENVGLLARFNTSRSQ